MEYLETVYLDTIDGFEFEIENIQEREKEIQLKIKALDTIFEYIREKLDGHYSHNDNFKFYEDENGNFVIRWDST